MAFLKSLLSGLGSIAGSVLMPGVGTAAGGALGSAIGGGVEGLTEKSDEDKAKMQQPAQQSQPIQPTQPINTGAGIGNMPVPNMAYNYANPRNPMQMQQGMQQPTVNTMGDGGYTSNEESGDKGDNNKNRKHYKKTEVDKDGNKVMYEYKEEEEKSGNKHKHGGYMNPKTCECGGSAGKKMQSGGLSGDPEEDLVIGTLENKGWKTPSNQPLAPEYADDTDVISNYPMGKGWRNQKIVPPAPLNPMFPGQPVQYADNEFITNYPMMQQAPEIDEDIPVSMEEVPKHFQKSRRFRREHGGYINPKTFGCGGRTKKMEKGGTSEGVLVNIEKNELLADKRGNILKEFNAPPHPEKGVNPAGNRVVPPETYVIPDKDTDQYKNMSEDERQQYMAELPDADQDEELQQMVAEKGGRVSMPKKEFRTEHNRLVNILRSGSDEEREEEADEQEDELEEEGYKKGGWIQKATASIKKRGTEGVCTGDKFGSDSCPPGSKRYNLAKTFKKMAKNRKEDGGYANPKTYGKGGLVKKYEDGGPIEGDKFRYYQTDNQGNREVHPDDQDWEFSQLSEETQNAPARYRGTDKKTGVQYDNFQKKKYVPPAPEKIILSESNISNPPEGINIQDDSDYYKKQNQQHTQNKANRLYMEELQKKSKENQNGMGMTIKEFDTRTGKILGENRYVDKDDEEEILPTYSHAIDDNGVTVYKNGKDVITFSKSSHPKEYGEIRNFVDNQDTEIDNLQKAGSLYMKQNPNKKSSKMGFGRIKVANNFTKSNDSFFKNYDSSIDFEPMKKEGGYMNPRKYEEGGPVTEEPKKKPEVTNEYQKVRDGQLYNATMDSYQQRNQKESTPYTNPLTQSIFSGGAGNTGNAPVSITNTTQQKPVVETKTSLDSKKEKSESPTDKLDIVKKMFDYRKVNDQTYKGEQDNVVYDGSNIGNLRTALSEAKNKGSHFLRWNGQLYNTGILKQEEYQKIFQSQVGEQEQQPIQKTWLQQSREKNPAFWAQVTQNQMAQNKQQADNTGDGFFDKYKQNYLGNKQDDGEYSYQNFANDLNSKVNEGVDAMEGVSKKSLEERMWNERNTDSDHGKILSRLQRAYGNDGYETYVKSLQGDKDAIDKVKKVLDKTTSFGNAAWQVGNMAGEAGVGYGTSKLMQYASKINNPWLKGLGIAGSLAAGLFGSSAVGASDEARLKTYNDESDYLLGKYQNMVSGLAGGFGKPIVKGAKNLTEKAINKFKPEPNFTPEYVKPGFGNKPAYEAVSKPVVEKAPQGVTAKVSVDKYGNISTKEMQDAAKVEEIRKLRAVKGSGKPYEFSKTHNYNKREEGGYMNPRKLADGGPTDPEEDWFGPLVKAGEAGPDSTMSETSPFAPTEKPGLNKMSTRSGGNLEGNLQQKGMDYMNKTIPNTDTTVPPMQKVSPTSSGTGDYKIGKMKMNNWQKAGAGVTGLAGLHNLLLFADSFSPNYGKFKAQSTDPRVEALTNEAMAKRNYGLTGAERAQMQQQRANVANQQKQQLTDISGGSAANVMANMGNVQNLSNQSALQEEVADNQQMMQNRQNAQQMAQLRDNLGRQDIESQNQQYYKNVVMPQMAKAQQQKQSMEGLVKGTAGQLAEIGNTKQEYDQYNQYADKANVFMDKNSQYLDPASGMGYFNSLYGNPNIKSAHVGYYKPRYTRW